MIVQLTEARRRRAALCARLTAEGTDCYRLLHRSGDGLDEVTVDVFGQALLLTFYRAGLEEELAAAVAELLPERPIYLRHKHERRPVTLWAPSAAHATPDGRYPIREGGLVFLVEPERGQNPGFFLDTRPLRRWIDAACRQFVGTPRVANLFAYTGSLGVVAAAAGARVWHVDTSAGVLERARQNHQRNDLMAGVVFLKDDARKRLQRFAKKGPRFDLIVCDPPSAALRRTGGFDAERHYPRLVQRCVAALAPSGRLVITRNARRETMEELRTMALDAAEGRLEVETELTAGPDFRPEVAAGLKIVVLRAVPAS